MKILNLTRCAARCSTLLVWKTVVGATVAVEGEVGGVVPSFAVGWLSAVSLVPWLRGGSEMSLASVHGSRPVNASSALLIMISAKLILSLRLQLWSRFPDLSSISHCISSSSLASRTNFSPNDSFNCLSLRVLFSSIVASNCPSIHVTEPLWPTLLLVLLCGLVPCTFPYNSSPDILTRIITVWLVYC